MKEQSVHGIWSGRWTFMLAATGSAVGLGNIWKFPYIAGENGGGAFVLVYLVCILAVGIPIMMAEVLMGRRGRQSPINTVSELAADAGATRAWGVIGWVGVLAGFLILSFYSVIAGWALSYLFKTASGDFVGIDADQAGAAFNGLLASPGTLTLWHTVFMVLTVFVIARGVNKGLEKAVEILMPLLFLLLLVLLGFAMTSGAFSEGLGFLFSFDFSKALTADAILEAMGHSFFTLSLGMGAIMVYGAYMPKHISIGKTVLVVAAMDTLVALMAGMVIFPIVFANQLDPGAGPGLMFVTLPLAFGHMTGGAFFGSIFFILVIFAAWSSAISLLEPAVSWMVEKLGMDRVKSTIGVGVFCWVLGLATVLSFNQWAEFKFLAGTVFDNVDYLTAKILLPLGGLLVAIFAGWVMTSDSVKEELEMGESVIWSVFSIFLRFISPALVILVFLHSLGVF